MAELEKIIERLEYCAETRDGYVRDCINDALELLKEYQHMDKKMIVKNCFTCANSFVDDDDNLHCMAYGHNHEQIEQIVDDDNDCEDWNR